MARINYPIIVLWLLVLLIFVVILSTYLVSNTLLLFMPKPNYTFILATYELKNALNIPLALPHKYA